MRNGDVSLSHAVSSANRVERVIRETEIVETLFPLDQIRHDAAIRETIDRAGRIDPREAAPLRNAITLDWSTIDGRPKRTPQFGSLVLLWVHANTPPSAGSVCVVTFTMEQRGTGVTPIGSVTLASGNTIGEEVVAAQPLPAGTYLMPTVTSAGGASGVSAGVVIRAKV